MRSLRPGSHRPLLTICLVAILLTAVVGVVVSVIQTQYFNYYPYFFDHVYYSYLNVNIHEQIARDGQLAMASEEWFSNGRHPLRTTPLVLFAPQLLTEQLGHLATSLPFLAAFVALLGLHVHRRTGNLTYSLSCMGLFMAMPGLLDPRQGMGAYWLETAASPLLGSAVLCLLLSNRGRHLRWLGGFAMFAALACLSRYITVAFVIVLCAPIVAIWLTWRIWEERNLLSSLVMPCLVIGIISGALAGPFLYKHTAGNVEFYSSLGPVGQGNQKAFEFTALWVETLAGPMVIGVLVVAAGVISFAAYRSGRVAWGSLALSVWIASALIVLLVLQGAAEARHVIWFVVPPLFIALVAPVPILPTRRSPGCAHDAADPSISRTACTLTGLLDKNILTSAAQKQSRYQQVYAALEPPALLSVLGAILGSVTIGIFTWTAVNGWRSASDPPATVAGQKTLDVALATVLAGQGPGLVWNSYFDEYAWIPTMETYYRFGQLVLPAGQRFYHYHAPHWAFEYPGYSPEALGRRVADGTTKLVDLAVVLDDPRDADTNTWMTNPHSRAVSRIVAEEVKSNPTWERLATIDSTQYGRLAVYRNQTANGVGYEQALRNRLAP